MPWWSWIVIWIALVALSLLFIGVLGVRLFRQFMAVTKELAQAGDRFSTLGSVPATSGSAVVQAASVGSDSGAGSSGTGAPAEPGSAVFAPPETMRQNYHASKAARQEARRIRRVERKAERGQPQALRDIDPR
ncbi:hypothetical protein [Arthrobacter sp. B3I4]|uniref:hypothetical protein n=1 Tax=Arthrobacter sp. B3I4 TaxID=3042267 RepID=UPI00277E36CC|nr:hypothetical protein [Arthrobacter sp. B3I4]MDQ0756434.1 hypothetical protein [Arthrobacter sp. B3I4]